jgi:curved DNA-binding protein CbpA
LNKIKNYYEILHISPYAGKSEIKSAYRRLAKIYHPDLNDNSPKAEALFKLINNAYNILINSREKETYDSFLRSSYFHNRKDTVQDDRSVLDSVDSIFGQVNVLLWDIEDYLRYTSVEKYAETVSGKPLHYYIVKILDFMDKWIFDPDNYIPYLEGKKSRSKLQLQNYFFHLRLKINEFFRESSFEDLLKQAGCSKYKKIDCIFAVQKHTIYYLNHLINKSSEIPEFIFS